MSHQHKQTERNILIAFILNASFSVFEFFGGLFTGSVAILSDALHDAGDALSIGISYFLEKKSTKNSNETHTFGYRRYSTLGALITTLILLIGSGIVICGSVRRFFELAEINDDGMIIIAIFGFIVNFAAAYFTHKGDSLNQRAVNLHMLEDVLGWAVVLVGSVVIKFTGFTHLDSIMSIGIAIFLIIESCKNLKHVLDLILEKTPDGLSVKKVKSAIKKLDNVRDVHHIRLWSLDGEKNLATMHVVIVKDDHSIKFKIKSELQKFNITDATIELEVESENCTDKS